MTRASFIALGGAAITLAVMSAAFAANDRQGSQETVVDAPGGYVRTDGEGTTVEAPFTEVEKRGGETHIRAPFVDITVPSGGRR